MILFDLFFFFVYILVFWARSALAFYIVIIDCDTCDNSELTLRKYMRGLSELFRNITVLNSGYYRRKTIF